MYVDSKLDYYQYPVKFACLLDENDNFVAAASSSSKHKWVWKMGAKVDITSECKIYSGPSIIMHANNYCEFTRERSRKREQSYIFQVVL